MTQPTLESLAARVAAIEDADVVRKSILELRLGMDAEPSQPFANNVRALIAERDALRGELIEFAEALKPWGEHRECESPRDAVLRILVDRKSVARQRNAAQQEVANLKAQIAAIEAAVAAARKESVGRL